MSKDKPQTEELFGQSVESTVDPTPTVETITERVVETPAEPKPKPVQSPLSAAAALVIQQVEADESIPRVDKKNMIRTLRTYG